jgi:hypothetical protein
MLGWKCWGRGGRLAAILATGWALAALLPASGARAQCIGSPVQTNQTCTNSVALTNTSTFFGTNIGLQDNGTLTVTNTSSGTITATGSGYGILASTANVTNFGTIMGGSYGINVTNANVTNSGSISGGLIGIYGGATANVTNSGSISGGTYGISSNTANVTNSGSISGGTYGVIANTTNVTNSGSISGSYAIYATGIANVTNSGSISGAAFGVIANTANVTNSGTISGSYAIYTPGIANVTNSGTIIGTGGTALRFSSAADTLTLLPGSRIIGAINMGGGADVVNFKSGPGASGLVTLTNFTGTINGSGNAPFAIRGNQIATLDPTPFAMTDRTLMDFTRGVSSVLDDRFGDMAVVGSSPATAFAPESNATARFNDAFDSIPGLSAYAGDAMVFKNPTVQYSDGTSVWARGFAGQRVQQEDGVLLHTLNQFYGGMIGGDWQAQANLRLGAFLGAGKTRSSTDLNSGDSDSDLVFGGVFGRYAWGASFLSVALQGGHSHTSTTRNINNNLAPGGLESATATYDGWYVNPEATVGHNFALGSLAGASYTLTPSLQVRYLYGWFGGYTESGSTANLTVGSRAVADFEERGQLKLTRTQVFAPNEMLMTSVYGGVLGVQRVGSSTVDAILLGQAIPFATPGTDSVGGGFGGAGLEWRTGRVSLFASGEYLALSDASSVVSGKGGIRVAF